MDRKWAIGLVLAIFTLMGSYFVPEVRCFIGLESEACSGKLVDIDLTIKTPRSEPLKGVRVDFQDKGAPETRYTDSNGFVTLKIPSRNDVTIYLTKKGFEPSNYVVDLRKDSERTRTYFLEEQVSKLPVDFATEPSTPPGIRKAPTSSLMPRSSSSEALQQFEPSKDTNNVVSELRSPETSKSFRASELITPTVFVENYFAYIKKGKAIYKSSYSKSKENYEKAYNMLSLDYQEKIGSLENYIDYWNRCGSRYENVRKSDKTSVNPENPIVSLDLHLQPKCAHSKKRYDVRLKMNGTKDSWLVEKGDWS